VSGIPAPRELEFLMVRDENLEQSWDAWTFDLDFDLDTEPSGTQPHAGGATPTALDPSYAVGALPAGHKWVDIQSRRIYSASFYIEAFREPLDGRCIWTLVTQQYNYYRRDET
jgi:hypothetical protein